MEELPEELYERWLLEEEAIESPQDEDAPEPASRLADPDEPDGLRYEYDEGPFERLFAAAASRYDFSPTPGGCSSFRAAFLVRLHTGSLFVIIS